jgi:hypothetical protein
MRKQNNTTITSDMLVENDGRGIRLKPEIVKERQRREARPQIVPRDQDPKEDAAHPDWARLADALAEICSNKATPVHLFNLVVDYLSSNSGELWGRLMITPANGSKDSH